MTPSYSCYAVTGVTTDGGGNKVTTTCNKVIATNNTTSDIRFTTSDSTSDNGIAHYFAHAFWCRGPFTQTSLRLKSRKFR